MSTEARQLVEFIHQKISQIPILDVAQLPVDSEMSQVETVLRQSVQGASPELQQRIENEYFGSGPLEPLLMDENVTEIIINGAASVCYEKRGKLHVWPDSFLSSITYKNFIIRLSRDAQVQVTIEHPFASAKWHDFRLHMSAPPCAEGDVVVCLRRHPKQSWTLEKLIECNWCTKQEERILEQLVNQRKNILVIGPTGSGKTSVLNALLSLLGPDERVLIIEDTPELVIPNRISSRLLTRSDPQHVLREIDQGELVRQALRMRPDRLVLGEVRGPEAKDMLLALATGHSGSWGSLHADSARQALLRLEMLIQLGSPQWSVSAIRNLILVSLHAIIVLRRDEGGDRKLDSIHRITSLEEFGFLLEQLK